MSDQQKSKGTEVVKRGSAFTDDELQSLDWTQLAAFMEANPDVATVDVTDFGTGFTVLSDKNRLVGEPFVIVDWRFSLGTYGEMVTLLVVAKSGKWIVNDGSTGIREQMSVVDKKMPEGAKTFVQVPKGLTRSDYTYLDQSTGKETPAQTFYLSMDKAQ